MACQALDVIAAGVTVLSAVGRRRRMMVFSGVASQCEERGAMPAGTNFEIAATIVPSGTLVPPKRFSVRSVAHAATPPQSNSGHHHPEKFRVWISGQVRRVTKPIRRETIAAAIVALPLRITSRAPSNGWGILRVLVSMIEEVRGVSPGGGTTERPCRGKANRPVPIHPHRRMHHAYCVVRPVPYARATLLNHSGVAPTVRSR